MKVNRSISIDDADFMSKGDLEKFFAQVPDDAKLDIQTHSGDYGRMDYHSLTFDWKEEL